MSEIRRNFSEKVSGPAVDPRSLRVKKRMRSNE
jgi:hypothetical protein